VRYIALVLLIVLIFSISAVQQSVGAETEWQIYEIMYVDQMFKIPYKITNGDVKNIGKEAALAGMILNIESHSINNGTMEITIPQNLLDSKLDYEDEDFVIEGDGEHGRSERWSD